MAQIPQIEFALSEYGTFEYSYESSGGSHFASLGTTSVGISTGVVLPTLLQIEAAAGGTLASVQANSGGYSVEGVGAFIASGMAYHNAQYIVEIASVALLKTQAVRPADVSISGFGDTSYYTQRVNPSTVQVVAGASIDLLGQSTHHSTLSSPGVALFDPVGSSYAYTKFHLAGQGTALPQGSHILQGVLSSYAHAITVVNTQQIHVGSLESHSTSSTLISGSAVANGSLEATPLAVADIKGSQIVYTELLSEGKVFVEFDALGSGNSRFLLEGQSETLWAGGRIINVRAYSTARTSMDLHGSSKRHAELHSSGSVSAWIFQPQDNPEYTIRSRASVLFSGQAKKHTDFVIHAASIFGLQGLGTTNGVFLSEGSSETLLVAQPYRMGTVTFRGESVSALQTSRRITAFSDIAISGRASPTLRSSYRQTAFTEFNSTGRASPVVLTGKGLVSSLQSQGSAESQFAGGWALTSGMHYEGYAAFDWYGSATVNGILNSQSLAETALSGVSVAPADAISEGSSVSYFYVGSVVFTFLPKAFDGVVRDYEPRDVIRPSEIRLAEFR